MNRDRIDEALSVLLADGLGMETLSGWQVRLRVAVDAIAGMEDSADRFAQVPEGYVTDAVDALYRLYLRVQDEMPEHCDGCGWGLEEADGAFGVLEGEPVRWCWECDEPEGRMVDRDTYLRAVEGRL